MTTPIRRPLRDDSALTRQVKDGLGALERSHRSYVADGVKAAFHDSLEIDEALRKGAETQNRWDYLLGHGALDAIVGLEPHHASTSAVNVVIAKRKAALVQLRAHLRDSARVAAWFCVASGKVDFVPHEKCVNLLAQNGVRFVGKLLQPKHLEGVVAPKPRTKGRRQSRT